MAGIDSLTNSFGLVTMCRGGAAILGPPLAGAIFEATDRNNKLQSVPFYNYEIKNISFEHY